jgi:SAM-dependent methyltransferase
MVVSRQAAGAVGAAPERLVWHDLECGAYEADLELWRELAGECGEGEVLDVGAGSGRVTLDLARRGHRVTALDRDPVLLGALAERAAQAGGLPVRTVEADARSFRLDRDDYALCVVPMQTIQLLAGTEERISFFESAGGHLRAGASLACAIVTDVDPFDCASGGLGPSAERVRLGTTSYASRAVRVEHTSGGIEIERERTVRPDGARATRTIDVVTLARVDARTLEAEGAKAGLAAVGTRRVAETDEHAGSVVVMLRA